MNQIHVQTNVKTNLYFTRTITLCIKQSQFNKMLDLSKERDF